MNTSIAMNIHVCKKKNVDTNQSISFFNEDVYTLIYVVSGKGKIVINNASFQFQANSVICIRPQCKAKMKVIDMLSIIYVQYSGGESDYLYKMSSFKKIQPVCVTHTKETLFCFRNIEAEMEYKRNNRYYLVAEILHIFSHFTPSIAIMESRRYQNRYLQKAINEIQVNTSMPISVNLLAERVNVDRSYLYRIFKKETGFSPREYMIDYKLRLSAEKIKKKKENIQSIFGQLGFSSYYMAEKKFKEKYGVTPREYRKQEGFEEANGKIKNH